MIFNAGNTKGSRTPTAQPIGGVRKYKKTYAMGAPGGVTFSGDLTASQRQPKYVWQDAMLVLSFQMPRLASFREYVNQQRSYRGMGPCEI